MSSPDAGGASPDARVAPVLALHRSYLYAPGSDARVVAKALAAGADAVIIDLEDAVAPGAEDAARAVVAEVVAGPALDAPGSVHVRVDRGPDGSYLVADLEAAVGPGLDAIRLPKVEDPAAVAAVDATLTRLEAERGLPAGRIGLYLTFESALGVVQATELLLASPRVVRAAIGTSDLLADLGAAGDDDLATLHVRSELVLRSRACRVGPPIDSVHTDLADVAGLEAAARRARTLGFHGKSVIHPRQLAAVHAAFTPTAAELAHADRVVAAADEAARHGAGGVALDGDFVDAAVVARARALLATDRNRS